MKKISVLIIIILTVFWYSCEKEEPVTVSASDFEVTIDENPEQDAVLGTVDGSTNQGSVIFNITSSTPEGAFAIEASTGKLTVADADLFDFETNQTLTAVVTVSNGYSRDDSGKFLPVYFEKGILENNPFEVLDQEGVGQLVTMGVNKGRKSNPEIKLGVCGEHGGEPQSIEFFHKIGIDYMSCSPYRVPIAKLAAAQAALHPLTM